MYFQKILERLFFICIFFSYTNFISIIKIKIKHPYITTGFHQISTWLQVYYK